MSGESAKLGETAAGRAAQDGRLMSAARAAGLGALALSLAAAATLWASEGARVFADAAFSAMLACL